MGTSADSWESLIQRRDFQPLYGQTRTLMERMYELGKPVGCMVIRCREASPEADPAIDGARELTFQTLRQWLQPFPRGQERVAPAHLEAVGTCWFVLLPGRGAATHEADLVEILDALAAAPWATPGGFIPRRVEVGMAFWSPAMTSHDPLLFLGSAFQALVMASFGAGNPLPDGLRQHPADGWSVSVNAWEGPRRGVGVAPIVPAPHVRTATVVNRVPPEVARAQNRIRQEPEVPQHWLELAEACERSGLAELALVARREARLRQERSLEGAEAVPVPHAAPRVPSVAASGPPVAGPGRGTGPRGAPKRRRH